MLYVERVIMPAVNDTTQTQPQDNAACRRGLMQETSDSASFVFSWNNVCSNCVCGDVRRRGGTRRHSNIFVSIHCGALSWLRQWWRLVLVVKLLVVVPGNSWLRSLHCRYQRCTDNIMVALTWGGGGGGGTCGQWHWYWFTLVVDWWWVLDVQFNIPMKVIPKWMFGRTLLSHWYCSLL